MLKKSDLKEVTQAFATESRKMGLSDWASAMLVEKYINAVMPQASQNEKLWQHNMCLPTVATTCA